MRLILELYVNAAGRLAGTLKPAAAEPGDATASPDDSPARPFDGALELLALLEAAAEAEETDPPHPAYPG